jgi:hypothetical protein
LFHSHDRNISTVDVLKTMCKRQNISKNINATKEVWVNKKPHES